MAMFGSTVSCIYCASRILFERRESSCIQSAVVQNLHGLGQDYRPGNLAGDGQRRSALRGELEDRSAAPDQRDT